MSHHANRRPRDEESTDTTGATVPYAPADSARTTGSTDSTGTTDSTATTTVLPDWVSTDQPSSIAPEPPAAIPVPAQATSPERPTIRWGALVWSLLFGATAGFTLWVLVEPARRLAVGEWFLTLNPLAGALYGLVAVGIVLALFGIVGLIRRGERTRRA